MTDTYHPIQFIAEPVLVEFDRQPLFSKSPDCPSRFIWRDHVYHIVELLSAWQDFGRRGRMSRNMRPERLALASRRGSWGVGKFFFRVRTADGRIFDLYYDRAPKSAHDRLGQWFLFRELAEGAA
ncbi:MAG: hypothetical protein D6775_08470 [Caldilineae bacterium]|nr:MAG: hypothetical protein D6775_08470 [Caldilineae bacterium]